MTSKIRVSYWIYSLVIVYSLLIRSAHSLSLDDIDKSDIRQIIEARNFTCETHYITTSDGYILANYRIVNPYAINYFNGSQFKPILIQSGFLGSAVDFIINSPKGFLDHNILINSSNLDSIDFDTDGRNLGFILANLGYDVWLTNPRGNYYSSNHTKLDLKKDGKKFWSFSLDEMALIDLPAMIDYVRDKTGQSTVGYIGFSRASLLMFALLSDRPEYNDKVSPFISLAPPVYLNNFKTPLKLLAATKFVSSFVRDHPGRCFDRSVNEVVKSTIICNNILIHPLCHIIELNLLSIDPKTSNASRLDVYTSHLPSGSSCWDFIHFAQRMNHRYFTKIDLGASYNLKHYGNSKPPVYDLSKINNTNIAIIHSTGDETANPFDVGRLIRELKVPLIDHLEIQDNRFDHLDFLFNVKIGNSVNKRIAKILSHYRRALTKPLS